MLLSTLCLASTVSLDCSNEICGYTHDSGTGTLEATIGIQDHRKGDRSTDYAINVLWVLGFISVGDGCTEAARLLGLLGLPNDTTMESRSFTIIEERISPYIHRLTDEILHENLTEEVRRTVTPEVFQLWKSSTVEGVDSLLPHQYPKLDASYDMAWQQRNSGNTYNSPSGHALYMGGKTRKPISLCIKSKLCNICSAWTSNSKNPVGIDPPPHQCTKNHDGTSGSMEPQACLEMTVDLYDHNKVCISRICLDDDASTRSLLKWTNANWMNANGTTNPPLVPITKGPNVGKLKVRIDHGRLPPHIPEPTFVADPNHRKKVWTGDLYNIL
jgi:hypothetical protein